MGQAGDERSDIYSLGAVLYQLVTGTLPFDADTSMGVVLKHINEPLRSARSVRHDLPVSIDRVITRAMAKDPAQRYQKAGEFAKDLRRAAAGQEVQPLPKEVTAVAPAPKIPAHPTPIPMTPTPPPWRRMEFSSALPTKGATLTRRPEYGEKAGICW